MDYDDNESQNLHLVGEGSTQFPPVLRPYALPKFEFDESLQGHLRFDSLVGTEAFLGIESHEDSQWIDAFSRGSSGIEFSSAAAESCSISRHNNVWSEATSSESVEMLLKSVGQEELVPRHVAEESDACDELACLTKQMKPNPKPDVKNVLEKNVRDLKPPDVIHGSLSGLKEDVGREVSQADVSQGHGVESSIIGGSSNLESNDMYGNTNLPVSEGSLYADGNCNEVNQVVGALTDDSLNDKVHDLSASGVQANASAVSMKNNSSTCDLLNIENLENCVIGIGDVQQGCLQSKLDKQDMESSTWNRDAHIDTQTSTGLAPVSDAHSLDKPLCSVSTEQALEGVKAVEGLDAGMNGVVSGADLLKTERCSGDISSENSGRNNADALVDVQSGQNLCDSPKAEIKGDTSSKEQVVEISNPNHAISSDHCLDVITIERNTYSGGSAIKEKVVLNMDHPTEKDILVSQSEGHVIIESEGNGDNKVGDLSLVASSKNSLSMSETTQTCEKYDIYGQGDHKSLQKVGSVNEDMSTKVPTVSSQRHCDTDQSHLVDKEVDSSSLSIGSGKTESTTSKTLASSMAVNESASKVMLEDICLVPCKTMDAPPPSSNLVSINEVTDNNNVQKNTSALSAPVDGKQDPAKVVTEVAISTGVGSTEKEASRLVNGTEIHASSDASTNLMCKTVNNCPEVEGTTGTEKLSELQGTQIDKVIQECASVSDVSSVPCGSTVKRGDEVAVSFDKLDKESHEKSSSKLSGDILHASQVSIPSAPLPDSHAASHQTGDVSACPAPITSSSFITTGNSSQTEKDGDQVKASTDQNPSVSEGIDRDASAIDVPPIAPDTKESNASENEKILTSEVNPMADLSKTDVTNLTRNNVGKSQSLPAAMSSKTSTVEVSPTTSVLGSTKTKTAGDISHRSSASKGTTERKTRRTYNKTPRKESSRKRGVKETTPARQPERGDKPSNVSVSPSSNLQPIQSREMQQRGHADSSSTKPYPFLNASTSGLPDLNSSASLSVLCQQSFTDLQQVQLRSQIFVYGALIQGMAPDEAYMISAFGGPDGGRNTWERAWRACIERQLGQKSHSLNPETPQQSRSVKQSTLQGNAVSSPLGLASSNATPTIVNPLMPLSSPLWTIPTPCDSLQSSAVARGSVVDYPQALASLHSYQTSPLRNFLGHNTSWISQAPLHVPWIASTPPPGSSSHPSASPVSGTVKLSSVKGSPLPPSSGIKNVISSIPSSAGGPQSMFVASAPLHSTNVTVSPGQHSSDPKPKKRKKVLISEDLSHKALQSQTQLELTSAVISHLSTSISIAASVGNVPKTNMEKSVVSVSTLSPADHLQSDKMNEKRALSDESLGKVKEATAHAEEAASSSAAAVSHSLEIWNQLDKQKYSGLVSDIEAKLASAAVAVAAAAAVAKAAAAAASVASNAALQAKLMADETLVSSGHDNPCQSIELPDSINKFGKATPASMLRGTNGTNSSITVAAKEAVRRRVEAASVAAKRAENMEAIVKAAELAAEAVSRAGKLVNMNDPVPFSDLIDAAPEGFQSVAQESSQEVGLLKEMTRGLVKLVNAGDCPETSHTLNKDGFSGEMGRQMVTNEQPLHNEKIKDHVRPIDGISISINSNGKNTRGPKGRKVSDLVNSIDVVPESNTQTRFGSESGQEENIKEGSLIEVFKDGEGWKAAWYTANVLSLKDGDAYVCYTALVADGGAGPLKEWITFKGEGDKPPRIRIARPLTDLHHEGTRKRRRAAMRDFAWSAGDRVDAWIEESWREGVVIEIKKDETLTVHFPATGETSVVRAWYLRPSRIWKDGKWTECSRVGANDCSTREGDTPLEKRLKLGGPTIEAKGKDKMLKKIDTVEPVNHDELRLLNLTDNEKVFNTGKTSKTGNKPDTQRMARTGLQKEGSRVIFGVPKPGKKRKFMEVSKHYVADRSNKINDGNDSVKLANFLMPQVPGSRGLKSSSKNDAKEKRGANPKLKTSKPEKSHNVLDRSVPPQDNILANTFSQSDNLTDHTERIKDGSHIQNASDNGTRSETASHPLVDGAAEGPILFSSLPTSVDAPSFKKTSTSRASKGKLAPAGGKLGQIEEEKALDSDSVKSTSEANEPRRSNRRIQPTSRLLEGLQSSLIITKVPSVSHDKSHKNQSRNASRG